MSDIDLDAIKAAQARVYAEVSVYEKGDAALGFLDSGVVDDLVAEVERLRHVLETHEAQYRRHRDDGYRLSAKHERERDEARAEVARVEALCDAKDAEHAEYVRRIEAGELITLDRFIGPAQVNVSDVRAALRATP